MLKEYAILVDRIRRYQQEGMSFEAAAIRAVDECIQENVLQDYLLAHKAEVIDVLLTEYDEEQTLRDIREEGREEGLREGLMNTARSLMNFVRKGRITMQDAAEEMGISESAFRALLHS